MACMINGASHAFLAKAMGRRVLHAGLGWKPDRILQPILRSRFGGRQYERLLPANALPGYSHDRGVGTYHARTRRSGPDGSEEIFHVRLRDHGPNKDRFTNDRRG